MTQLKSEIKFDRVQYKADSDDGMWQLETDKLVPWLFGKGADIGCGQRSIDNKVIRVDIDENVHPDILAPGDKLPFKDGELDFVTAIHNFEHYDNQVEVLTEWLRVICVRGIIGIVHPDVDYTKPQKPESENSELLKNPFNRHYHEHTLQTFLAQLELWKHLGFKILDSGVACGSWSFYVILEKIK